VRRRIRKRLSLSGFSGLLYHEDLKSWNHIDCCLAVEENKHPKFATTISHLLWIVKCLSKFARASIFARNMIISESCWIFVSFKVSKMIFVDVYTIIANLVKLQISHMQKYWIPRCVALEQMAKIPSLLNAFGEYSFRHYFSFMTTGEDRKKVKNWHFPFCQRRPTKLTENAFALLSRVSISLFRIPSLVNSTPRYLNVTCCNVLSFTCSIYCIGFIEGHNTSIVMVLIFIPGRSHAAENRSSACWRSCSEDASSTKSSAKKEKLILQFQIVTSHSLRCDCLSNSCRTWIGVAATPFPEPRPAVNNRVIQLRRHGHKLLSRNTEIWRPMTGCYQHRTPATQPKAFWGTRSYAFLR